MIWLLFALIQIVNIPLTVLGWFICLSPQLAKLSWLWWNNEDGAGSNHTWWAEYVWLAWRNPVNNLRFVPGVSAKGRPLLYWSNGRWYAKMGWLSDGYPCMSAGAGKGY
jgi:hypothetical protein